jgi:hypothetical protein
MSDIYWIDKKAFDPYWNEPFEPALAAMVEAGYIRPAKPEHQHQWLPWLALPNGSSWTQCTGCGEEVQFDHQ